MQNPPPGPPPGGPPPNYQPPGGQQPPPNYQPPGQQPPPPGQQPPGYQPPGYQPQGYQSSAPSVDKKTGAVLSYLLWWITGLIFLFVGRDDPDVKYHAAQSVVFFGAMTVVFALVSILRGLVGVIDVLLGVVDFALVVVWIIAWITCMMRAASGNGMRFEIPFVGPWVTPYAEQLAAAVN